MAGCLSEATQKVLSDTSDLAGHLIPEQGEAGGARIKRSVFRLTALLLLRNKLAVAEGMRR